MQATVLIIDSIAINRVAMKVKLEAAWYQTECVESGRAALAEVARHKPGLIVTGLSLDDMSVCDFCAHLRQRFGASAPPILAVADDPSIRAKLLCCGVEDVLPARDNGQVLGQVLLARMRSVLRTTAAEEEWRLREGTTGALGFAEPRVEFDRAIEATVLRGDMLPSATSIHLAPHDGLLLRRGLIEDVYQNPDLTARATVLVLESPPTAPARALTALSDLRSSPQTRHKGILVSVPSDQADLAAQALDLGADEATLGPLEMGELSVRIGRLHRRHEVNNRLRSLVKNGAEESLRDPLTGLYNRRYAMPHLARIAKQAAKSAQPFAVMMADLDHFKRINDCYGHDAGDAVLVECAKRLQLNMRAGDMVARIGGEEFLIVLPATARTPARQAALRLCQRIAEAPFVIPQEPNGIPVTISVGMSLYDAGSNGFGHAALSHEPESMLSRADQALYRAKENGRNRFMLERSAA